MQRDDEKLLLLVALWLYARAEEAVPRAISALERGGARVYDWTHGEADDHADDLPGRQWTKAKVLALATRAGFVDPKLAAAVALAESGGVPHAIGDGGTSFGLWQIHVPAHPEYSRSELMDPEQNAHAAYRISGGGRRWDAWTTYKTGAYKRYL